MNIEMLPFQKLDAYQVAKELMRKVHKAQIRDAELRDQATRGAKSVFLGLCEGLRGFVGGGEAPRLAGCGVMDGGISPVRDAPDQAGVKPRSTAATSTRMDRHTMGTKQTIPPRRAGLAAPPVEVAAGAFGAEVPDAVEVSPPSGSRPSRPSVGE